MSFLKKHVAILSITLVGLILRLFALAHYGDFWGDEMFSFVYSQKPWLHSLHFWTLETNPPLHMVLLKLEWYLFPATELFARLPSVIFGAASIPALFIFSKRLFGKRTATIAALLLALSAYHIFMSATARGYALFLFLVILSFSLFHSLFIAHEATRKKYIWFALVTLGLLYTHLTSLLLLATEAFFLVILNRAALKKFFLTVLPVSLLLLPWALPALYFKLHNPSFGQAWFFNITPTWQTWLTSLHPLFGAMNPPWQFFLIALSFPLLLAYVIHQQKKTSGLGSNFLFILTLFFVPVIAATGLGLWNIKFFVIAQPAGIVLTAYLIDYCFRSPLLVTALLLVLTVPNLFGLLNFLPAEDWRTVNTFVSEYATATPKPLFIYSNFTDQPRVARYLHEVIPILPYYPYDTARWDEMVITKNYIRSIQPTAAIAAWYKKNDLENYSALFLLQSSTLGQIDIANFLEKNNWKLVDTTAPRLVGDDYQLRYYVHD